VLVAEHKAAGWGGRPDCDVRSSRELMRRHGGVGLGATAAGSAVAFRSAVGAVRCAVAILGVQDAPSELAFGVHAGELSAHAGMEAEPVVQAARLARIAGGGQVLVSAVVRALVGDVDELRFGEAREVTLPGLGGRMVVHEVRWGERRRRALRVVIADDAALVRDGVAALLRDNGVEVVGTASDSAELHEAVVQHRPDVALVDIRMPPTFTDEGLRAAIEARQQYPELGILVLSQYVEPIYTAELLQSGGGGVGYLLKERVGDVRAFVDAVRRVADGGTALDREVIARLMRDRDDSGDDELAGLTPREREVLELMAEGRTNAGIARALVVTPGAVEKHISNIFGKLGLAAGEDDHRRVLAVLAYLRAS
jgi:DNA-binding NarL/FixJ family response regulator